MKEIKINDLTEKGKEWDSLIETAKEPNIFAKYDYLNQFKGYKKKLLKIECDKKIVLMPLVYKKIAHLKLAVNPPLTPYLGPMFIGENNEYELLKKVIPEIVKKSGLLFFNYKLGYWNKNIVVYTWSGFDIHVNNTNLIQLQTDFERKFSKTIKRSFKKYEGNTLNMVVEKKYSKKDLEIIKKTHKRKNENLPMPENKYKDFFKGMEKNQVIDYFRVYDGKKHVATSYFIKNQHKIHYLGGGYDSNYSSITPWIFVKAMHKYKREGFEIFDTEGSSDQKINDFYSKFGGTPQIYFSISSKNRIIKVLRKQRLGK